MSVADILDTIKTEEWILTHLPQVRQIIDFGYQRLKQNTPKTHS